MLTNKKVKIIIITNLLVILFAGFVGLAQDNQTGEKIGCCEKRALNTGVLTTENLTEKKCKEIWYGGDDTKDYESTNWSANAVARGNKCEVKPAPTETKALGDPVFFNPQVSIPESKYLAGANIKVEEDTSLIAEYIIAIFKYAIGVIGIIATIVLMIAGIRWLTAGGNSGAIGEAKTMMSGSLIGLILTFCSFILLSTINTSLVNPRIQSIGVIGKQDLTTQGCCEKTAQDGSITAEDTDAQKCEEIKKKDVGATGYKSVTFYLSQKAKNNKCIETKGCCVLDMGTQIQWFEWPWGDTQVCANNVQEKECSETETKGVRNWIPLVGTTDDLDATPYVGKKCQDINDCKGNLICETMAECLNALNDKKRQ